MQHCCVFTVGPILEEQGRLDEAGLYYERAIRGFDDAGSHCFAALARIFLSGVVARQDDAKRAETLLDEARGLLTETGTARLGELAELMRAHVHLASAHHATRAGQWTRASTLQNKARELVLKARAPKRIGSLALLPLARCSTEARRALRILDKALETLHEDSHGLRVARDGSTYTLGRNPERGLPGGPMLRGLLLALAQHRMEKPGEVLTSGEILERCWPGERMNPTAAQRRVRALVWRLRQAGLEPVLLTGQRGGYLLDPAVPVALGTTPVRATAPGT